MKVPEGVVFLVVWISFVSDARLCPDNCQVIQIPPLATCDKDTGTCYRGCINGYFGDKCNMTCDDNCQEETCQQQDGSCTCRTGYTYHKGSCDQHAGVKCDSNDHCLNNNCVSDNRQDCREGCKPGWFGKFCDKPCSLHCVCDEVNGNCTSCTKGWHGAECGSSCSPGCVGKNCYRNGTCVDNCTRGSYGDKCDLKCSQHCVSGCDQLTGECVQCEAGRYGSTCQSECSAGCAGADNDCDRDGSCSSGCRKGFYGEKCDSCPQQCFGDSCDVHGTCTACKKGFFGTSCNDVCLRCKDGVCHQITGECIKGCDSGFYGSFCNLTCEYCTGGDCDRATGECRHKGNSSYIIGGGALFLVFVLAGLTACCLKRMRDIVKDGVDTIGQNTAVQFLPGHGTPLRSIELGNTDTNASGTNPDDTYNHLGAFRPPEATFSVANDDLETSSGYCAVLPLSSGLSCQHLDESVDGSGGGSDAGTGCGSDGRSDGGSEYGSDGGSDTGRNMISLCDKEAGGITVEEATAVVEKCLVLKPIQVVELPSEEIIALEPTNMHVPPDREKLTPEPIQIVDIRPVIEKRTPEPIQMVDIRPDREKHTPEPIQIVDIRPDREKRTPEPLQIVDICPDREKRTPEPIQIVDIRPDKETRTPEPIQIVDIRPDREKRTPEPIQIVYIRPDREKSTPEPIQIVDIRPDREKLTPEPIQIVDIRHDSENILKSLSNSSG